MFKIWQLDPKEQVFSWEDPVTGKVLHFAATQLGLALAERQWPVSTLAYPPNFAQFLLDNRGVDASWAAKLTATQLESPTIVCVFDEGVGQTLLIDGTHRSYARALRGDGGGPGYIVPQAAWEMFLIEGPDMRNDQILGLRAPSHRGG